MSSRTRVRGELERSFGNSKVAVSVNATSSCSGGDSTNSSSSSSPTGSSSNYTIAIVPKDATNPWFVRMETGVNKYAEETGLNVFQKGPAETDATMQAQVIQDLIAQGVDAIGVVPVDPGAIEPVLKEAMDAGIVVVTHEGASQENTMYDIEAFNNAKYGAFIMDNLAAAMGEKGTYTTMVGHVTNASHNEWADGAIARQKEAYPNMTLLAAEPELVIFQGNFSDIQCIAKLKNLKALSIYASSRVKSLQPIGEIQNLEVLILSNFTDRRRFGALGVAAGYIQVTGNLKFDAPFDEGLSF